VQRIPERQVEVASVFAVVASRSLPMGARLMKDDVKLVAWPAKSPLPGGFVAVEGVVDRGLIASVVENEPIIESKLAPVGAGAGLPPSIPSGMRAISVRVNEVIGVAGFVVPGTRVDVVVTVKQGQDSMSRVVVNNVQVLTAGTRYDQGKSKDSEPVPSTVVTLMVTPEDAERIALASTEGRIILTLRNPMDNQPSATQGVRMAGLMGAPAPEPVQKVARVQKKQKEIVAPPPAPPPPVQPRTVEAIRAAKRTEEVVH
jgi:pilus assembly protein CpaB